MLCYNFSSGAVLQDMAKINPTEKQINADIRAIFKHTPAQKLT